jgi:hypothetical protein
MLIVIPTYRRNAALKWVLQSVAQCHTDKIREPIRVLVVNNYPPARQEVERVVSEFSHERRIEWNVLCRQKTMPPVENWYSAIFDNALPNEIVYINGDDDLLMPWSLENRFAEIERLGSDMLLAQIDSGLFFFYSNAMRTYFVPVRSQTQERSATLLDTGTIFSYNPAHLSNHCYRNSERLRAGYEKAMSWCNAQEWLDSHYRTIFITLYLPYAVLLSGGSVAGLKQPCVIRGRDLEEVIAAPYGVPGWNHGFIHLCALGVLGNDELRDIRQLDPVRAQYRQEFAKWFLTCLWDSRVERSVLFETLRRVDFPVGELFSLRTLAGIRPILGNLTHLRGARLKRLCEKHSIPTEIFMKRLAARPSR